MIVIPALHPAREIVARVPALESGAVHRTATTLESVGGKAVNVARFVALMGGSVRLVVLADDALEAMLAADPVLGAAASGRSVDVSVTIVPAARSRVDLALVDDAGRATVVNGTAPRPAPADVRAVEQRTLDGLGSGDILVLAGSLPPGTSGTLDRLVGRGRSAGATVLVDASGPWLAEALAAGPHVVKVNREEASAHTGSAESVARRPPAFDGADIVAITDGGNGLRAWTDAGGWQLTPPPHLVVANTLGAGDAVTAGLALGLAEGRSGIEAVRLGAAMASARLRHLECTLDPRDVPSAERAIAVERLG